MDDGRCPDTDPNTTPEIPSRTSFVLCVVLCRFLSGASKAARALCAHLLNTYTQILTLHIKTSQNTDVKENGSCFPPLWLPLRLYLCLTFHGRKRRGAERRVGSANSQIPHLSSFSLFFLPSGAVIVAGFFFFFFFCGLIVIA